MPDSPEKDKEVIAQQATLPQQQILPFVEEIRKRTENILKNKPSSPSEKVKHIPTSSESFLAQLSKMNRVLYEYFDPSKQGVFSLNVQEYVNDLYHDPSDEKMIKYIMNMGRMLTHLKEIEKGEWEKFFSLIRQPNMLHRFYLFQSLLSSSDEQSLANFLLRVLRGKKKDFPSLQKHPIFQNTSKETFAEILVCVALLVDPLLLKGETKNFERIKKLQQSKAVIWKDEKGYSHAYFPRKYENIEELIKQLAGIRAELFNLSKNIKS